MEVQKTKFKDVLLIKPEPFQSGKGELFNDPRGIFLETYNEAKYKEHGIDISFVEDDISVSTKDVLRGLHGNKETWKLISCIHGEVFFVVVDCDEQSATFGEWESFTLNDKNYSQVLVPPMYGNGYLALTDKVVFHYKQSTYYKPGTQFTFRWDDPRFKINWPTETPILSDRDSNAK